MHGADSRRKSKSRNYRGITAKWREYERKKTPSMMAFLVFSTFYSALTF
jgi:hypothetical protein